MAKDFLERILWHQEFKHRIEQKPTDHRVLEETSDQDAGIDYEAHG
jgi:hypothetical protein